MSCACLFLVSQCRREGVQGGGGGLQLVNGVQGGLQSTVEVEVYSSLGNSLYCRLSGGSTVGLQ